MQVLTASAMSAETGITIQGASVGLDGSFAPKAPTPLTVSGTTVTGVLGAASGALVDVTGG